MLPAGFGFAWVERGRSPVPSPQPSPEGRGGQRKRRPKAAFGNSSLDQANYLAWSVSQCTALVICSVVSAGLPPLGGMKLPSGPW